MEKFQFCLNVCLRFIFVSQTHVEHLSFFPEMIFHCLSVNGEWVMGLLVNMSIVFEIGCAKTFHFKFSNDLIWTWMLVNYEEYAIRYAIKFIESTTVKRSSNPALYYLVVLFMINSSNCQLGQINYWIYCVSVIRWWYGLVCGN